MIPPVLEEDFNVANLEHHLIDSFSTLHYLPMDFSTYSLYQTTSTVSKKVDHTVTVLVWIF